MRHFHPPIHAAVVAVALVAGLASYQGVDKLVLAKGGATYGTTGEPGHDPSSSSTTSTTYPKTHHETGSTTSTTVHKETPPPSPTSSTSSTVPHEPGSSTSTTIHHETGSTTSTTVHKEPPPPTTPPTTAPPTTAPPVGGVAQLSFGCMSGFTGDHGWAKCGWSQSKSPNFDHYILTREVPGSSHVVIFQTSDVTNTYYVDGPLQAGGQYTYWVGAFDAAGHLIAQGGGPIHLVCCPGGVATP